MSHDPPLSLFDYEALAEAKLDPALWDFFVAGADDGVTLAENRRAFERTLLRPRVLVDVSRIDMATTLLGAPVAAPVMIAPTGPHGALCEEGEVATVAAAGRAGLGAVIVNSSNRTIEEIGAAATRPLWMQLYLYPERERTAALLARAEAAGVGAIVLTADSPRFGRKERSLRSEDRFDWPAAANLAGLPPATPGRSAARRRPGTISTG